MSELPIVERLRRKAQIMPAQGSGYVSIDSKGRVKIGCDIRDDGKRLANPDGPEAATLIEEQHGLLTVLEWGDDDRPGCPFCGMDERTGHLDRCQLSEVLAKARGGSR